MMGEIYIRHRMLAKTIGLLMVAGWLSMSPITAAAQSCEVTLEGNDAIRFSLKHISVDAACKDLTVHLKHVGKLPKLAMGHNWVLTRKADMDGVMKEAMAAGSAKDYLDPSDPRIIAYAPAIGAGQVTSVTWPVSKLKQGDEYVFFCSYGGHHVLMQGVLDLKR